MAVTIQRVNLLTPEGELDCSFFPDNNLESFIGTWVTEAKKKVEAATNIDSSLHDEAASQWVYYKAYSYLAGRFAAMPNSVSVNKGADSVSYGQDRVTYWESRAAKALAAYEGSLSPIVKVASRNSVPIRIQVAW